ncbi:hypothetical protein ACO0RG_004314 [Hanseniaspora osmophila]
MSLVNYTTDIAKVAETLNSAFMRSPSNLYVMKKIFNIKLDEKFSSHRNLAMMFYYASMYSDLGGELCESNNYNAVSLVSPPGVHIDFAETHDDLFNKIWYEDLDNSFKDLVGENPYYYICLVGRNFEQEKQKGSVTNIFKHYQKLADMKNIPIILESISEMSTQIYKHYGFKAIKKFKYGQGEVDENGRPDRNGQGFEAEIMVYYHDFDKLTKYRNSIVTVESLPLVDPKTYTYIPSSTTPSKNNTNVVDVVIPSSKAVDLSTGITCAPMSSGIVPNLTHHPVSIVSEKEK